MGDLSKEMLKKVAEDLAGVRWSDQDLEAIASQVDKWQRLIMALDEVGLGEMEPAVGFKMPGEVEHEGR